MTQLEKEKALLRLELAYGVGVKKGRKVTDSYIHKAGAQAIKELARDLGVNL